MPEDTEIGQDLTRALPPLFPRDDESGNFRLFQVAGHEFEDTYGEIEAVDRATTVQHADTIEQLSELAKLVGATPREGESREKFRARVIAQYQLATCEGSIEDLLNSLSVILDTDIEQIQYSPLYRNSTETQTVSVRVPKSSLDNTTLSDAELVDIINDLVPAPGTVEAGVIGTFEYVSASTYKNTSDWSTYEGYDGLDSNGNAKGGGGSYSGRLD